MANGQGYSRHQEKIISRYYDHRDTIMLTRLSEIVTDLYLCETEKKSAQLWKNAATALEKVKANPARSAKIMENKDIEGLAKLVNDMNLEGSKKDGR